jgi:serine/threonine protein kinase
MNKAERFRRVRELFDSASELLPEQRAAFVRAQAGGDTAIEMEVLRLLAAIDSANQGGFLNAAAWQRGGEEAPIKTGTWFGPYRVVRPLSSGGMGAVYLVARADDAYRRQAALKIIRADCLTPALVQRFHQERQILAELDHPNIARIVDGGTTSAGLPFFVMDYVDGQHLTAFCAQRRLPVEARVALFITVCRAVEYLHRNRITHRDLKPANILVSTAGIVKLVDFGIAKSLSGDPEVTRTAPLLTPGYASPEQLRNEPAGPAADVYSLGVVLYELLTGQRPFQREESISLQQWMATVEGAAPPAPSRVAGTSERHVTPENTGQLRRRLAGDLDTIVLMALQRDPARRYADAGAFAADLERHLSGHPVLARPDTLLYKGTKLLHRHRLLAVAAGFAVLAGGWGVHESLERQRLARRVAELENQPRLELASAERRLLAGNDPNRQLDDLQKLATAYRGPFVEALRAAPGMTPERDQLLGRTERYLGHVAELFGRNMHLQVELAAAYLLLGKLRGDPAYPNLGDRTGALRLYRQARTIAVEAGNDPFARELLQLIAEHERRLAVP